MTLESYERAKYIVTKIRILDSKISELRNIMQNDTSEWLLEVRAAPSCCLNEIDHYGMLPEMLQAILSKHINQRKQLVDELEKL